MVPSELRRRSICPGCGGPTRTPGLCTECGEAFALARAAHPSSTPLLVALGREDRRERALADDIELWDAWSLLGDVGDRRVPSDD